ncbi:Branched-chain-amino-acid aminotransferase, mitochondrial [Psilocybe cubensis]|uniref:Branched-chain-amino-acid aminotransferase n=2 Tax=Psilocybe cubensis TaxID=181762 RepID=A0A8H8CS55_PSICU|nr:Branched-chain-amino-acid aminotransferase, mitochondrial [Psilocybe cubensis]KAH9487398.1 Branched-chain-amino-acid aminotransferase, mitochondrial [Psilocybe cubensis]
MAIDHTQKTNGAAPHHAELDASKLVVTLASELKPIPDPETLVFGQTQTDHMLVVNYDPITGWGIPEIKPYGPLSLDPMSSCFHYCPNVFEGMKAYTGANGEARLFRPDKNMARLARSAERVALPPFDTKAVLELIKKLVEVDARWIPTIPGYSLYIRPTIIGTRAALGVAASDSACLYVILTPAGPYFRGTAKGIPLLAVGESVRSWPGGTGGHKLGLNYAPGFLPQRIAAKQGYEQILWLLGDDEKITEVGAMNFFVAVQREDGDVDLITPALDGTILPGITRESTLALADAHTSSKITLPGVPATKKIFTHERPVTMAELAKHVDAGRVLECFGVGTAVLVAPVGRIGWKGRDLVLPVYEGGLGPIGKGLEQTILAIQTGRQEFEGWSVPCF